MENAQSRDNTAIRNATDGQLFAWMSQRGALAKEAWAELYLRYMDDLHKLLFRVEGLPPADLKDLLQDTMKRAYQCAHTFRARDDLEAEASRGRTLLWLLAIARRLFISKLQRQKDILMSRLIASAAVESTDQDSSPRREVQPSELYQEVKSAEDRVAGVSNTSQGGECTGGVSLLRRALAALTPRDRDVLITYYQHYDPTRKKQLLPADERERLKKKYQINAGNIRQLRVRAQEAVKRYLESH
jgi:DNA-directed RNA polymerase specialized sigma24 family protein